MLRRLYNIEISFLGGFKSNEAYTYIRGRGRGKYVCEECGIRCKKPSMLKKHIRTHTDLRPYSCRHCAFAFKTKGNLTKHMKSKAHHKKCVEMGIIPVPVTIDESQIDTEALAKQEMMEISCTLSEDEDEEDGDDDFDAEEDEDEEDDEGVPIPLIELERFGVPKINKIIPGQFEDALEKRKISECESASVDPDEHEAARSLLILSGSGSESDLTTATRKLSKSSNEDITRHRKISNMSNVSVDSIRQRKISNLSNHLEELGRSRKNSFKINHNNNEEVIRPRKTSTISNHEQVGEINVVRQRKMSIYPTVSQISAIEETISRRISEASNSVLLKPLTPPSIILTPPSNHKEPRKLSPIEQLQAQVNHKEFGEHLQTWTPNCDTLGRPRSFSFNDLPLPCFPSARPHEAALPESELELNTDDSRSDSFDSFAARRYSTSVIAERRMNLPDSREEPMDLSVTSKSLEGAHSEIARFFPVTASSGLRQGEFIPIAPTQQPSDNQTLDGKPICTICSKTFSKTSQLRLHVNIHYFERPYRCDSCAVSFRTKGHLQKHKRSVSHLNKVNMNMTFGTPTTENPRPFKCAECKIAFRIHGHLAKHLRSKMHSKSLFLAVLATIR